MLRITASRTLLRPQVPVFPVPVTRIVNAEVDYRCNFIINDETVHHRLKWIASDNLAPEGKLNMLGYRLATGKIEEIHHDAGHNLLVEWISEVIVLLGELSALREANDVFKVTESVGTKIATGYPHLFGSEGWWISFVRGTINARSRPVVAVDPEKLSLECPSIVDRNIYDSTRDSTSNSKPEMTKESRRHSTIFLGSNQGLLLGFIGRVGTKTSMREYSTDSNVKRNIFVRVYAYWKDCGDDRKHDLIFIHLYGIIGSGVMTYLIVAMLETWRKQDGLRELRYIEAIENRKQVCHSCRDLQALCNGHDSLLHFMMGSQKSQRSREVEEQIEEIAANRMQEMFTDIERVGQIYDLSMPLEEFFAAMARGDKEPCPRLKKDPVVVKEEPLSAEEDEVKKEKPEVEEEDEVVVPADPIAEAASLPATPQFPDTIHPKKSVKPRKPKLNEPVFSANGTPLVLPRAVYENMLASPAAAEPMEYKDCD